MAAGEGTHIQSYYIPALGPAPKWCPFLDNLTEELEESPESNIYDDYKFVTRKELNTLALDHLIGTNLVKAYMHGFFLDLRLYQKAKAIANPFEYEAFKKAQVDTRIQKERQTRISAIKKLPKINRALAEKLLVEEDDDKKKSGKQRKKEAHRVQGTAENPIGDDRFAALFEDEDFQVDEEDVEYKLRHPSLGKAALRNKKAVEEEKDDAMSVSGSDGEGGEVCTQSHLHYEANHE